MDVAITTPMAASRTTIRFNKRSNLLATPNGENGAFIYEILGFDEGFSQHFSESTFGVSIPFVYFGFDLSVRAKASLNQMVEFKAGILDIDYAVDVNDLRAPDGDAVIADGRTMAAFLDIPVVWSTAYNFNSANLTPDGSNTAVGASLGLDYNFGFAIDNFRLGVDLYFAEFEIGPYTLLNQAIAGRYDIFSAVAGGGRDTAELGAFSGYMQAVDLPQQWSADRISGGVLPSISIEGKTAEFAHLQFDIAQFIGDLLGVKLKGDVQIASGLTFSYTILSVALESDLRIGQVITFTPMGIGVDIRTSIDAMANGVVDGFKGEHLQGALGDAFTLDTPNMGAGIIRVDASYTLEGTLRSEGQILATAGLDITALGAELHNRIIKDFDIGVGPLIDIEVPPGGIPLGGVTAYDRSVQLSMTTGQESFYFYWERPVEGTEGPDTLPLNPLTNAPSQDEPFYLTQGYGGDDVITGNIYNNPLRGDGGNDVIRGGAGLDFIRGDQGDDVLFGDGGIDTIYGGSGDDFIRGGEGDDFIAGMTGSDTLRGEAGDDVLNSSGLNGADRLEGGDGYDTAVIDRQSSFKAETINLLAPGLIDPQGATYRALADETRLYDIEAYNMRLGKGDDVVTMTGARNFIYGGDGADKLRSIGNDYFDGERGDDEIRTSWAGGGTYLGGFGRDRLILDVFNNPSISVDLKAVLAGTEALPNLIVAEFEAVTFNARGGDDTILGSDGDDVLNGGAGIDVLESRLGSDVLNGQDGDDILISSAYVLAPTFVVQPNGLVKRIGADERDVLDGGAGTDTAIINRTSSGNGSAIFDAGGTGKLADGTTLIGIEKLVYLGGTGADTVRSGPGSDGLTGNGGRDLLDGGAGNDSVDGGDGDDRVIGRAGELAGDFFDGGAGLDDLELDLSGTASGASLDLAMSEQTIAGVVRFRAFERFNITGTDFADVILGGDADPDAALGDGASADYINGADGDDVLAGRGGRDLVSGAAGADTIVWSTGDTINGGSSQDAGGAEQIDTLQIVLTGDTNAQSIVLGAPKDESTIIGAIVVNIERLDVTGGAGALSIVARDADDRLIGSSAADQVSAGAGNDFVDTRGGADTVSGGDGNDTITDLDGANLLSGDAGTDTLTSGNGISSLYGGIGNDRLVKALAANAMAAQGGGIDVLDGGGGDDTIVTGYRASIRGGEGYDVLEFASGDIALTLDVRDPFVTTAIAGGGSVSGIERLIFTGGAGEQTVLAGGDFGLLDGGAGFDSVEIDLRAATAAVFGSAPLGNAIAVGFTGSELRNFESVTARLGSAGDVFVVRSGSTGFVSALTLYGEAGNDQLGGGTGNDYLDGGLGNDIAVFRGTQRQYVIARDGDGWRISDSVAGRDGIDRIYAIEALQFADGFVALDRGNTINGTAGNDVVAQGVTPAGQLSVTDRGDIIFAGAGDDLIDGWLGGDRMEGGTGNDYYVVDNIGDQTFERPNEGIDTVYARITFQLDLYVERLELQGTANIDGFGNLLNDTLWGNSGNNTLDGLFGEDYMKGFAGDDTYYYDNPRDFGVESANEGYDAVFSTIASVTLLEHVEQLGFIGLTSGATGTGNSGENAIYGTRYGDILSGLGGPDTLVGDEGDDRLDGGTGTDELYGGNGNDTYFVDVATDVVFESTNDAADVLYSTAPTYSLGSFNGIETVIVSAGGGDIVGNRYTRTIIGNDTLNRLTLGNEGGRIEARGGNDVLTGGTGDDLLDGGSGNDQMTGGAGNDTYWIDATGDTVTEAADAGTDTIVTSLASYALPNANFERLVSDAIGGAGATLTGNDRDNEIIGNATRNVILTGIGNDRAEGGGGNDFLDGVQGNDVLIGGEGDDELRGGVGDDTLDGGSGDDRVYYASAASLYTIAATADGFTVTASVTGEGVDTLTGIELIQFGDSYVYLPTAPRMGSFGPDTLTGGLGSDTLLGMAGDDVIDGGLGADLLDGGGGDDLVFAGGPDRGIDRMIGGTGYDTVSYAAATSGVVVNLGLTSVQATSGAGDDQLAGFENLIGSDHFDTLIGDAGSNRIEGGFGNDTLSGLAGVDLLIGGAGNDVLRGGAGTDRLAGGEGDDLYITDGEDILLADTGGRDRVMTSGSQILSDGIETLMMTGTGDIDAIGNAIDNLLTGNVGANRIAGLAGNDAIDGGDGNDWLVGGDGIDRLTGGAGDDMLDGGTGIDRMTGGAGNDLYYVDNVRDVVVEAAAGGSDTVLASISYTLGSDVEKLVLIGDAAFATGNARSNRLVGSDGNNILLGLDGADVLQGGGGADRLEGGAGDDRLFGDAGRDVLYGGAGADSFEFATGDSVAARSGADIIADFAQAEGDRINLAMLDAHTNTPGNQTFTFIGDAVFGSVAGQLRFASTPSGTYVEADSNGDGVADFALRLLATVTLTATDFIL